MRDDLIKLISKHKDQHSQACKELRSVLTRHFPDRETFDTIQSIFQKAESLAPGDSVEIVLSPEHFGQKKMQSVSPVVEEQKPIEQPIEQPIDAGDELLEKVNALRVDAGEKRLPKHTKEAKLLDELERLQATGDDVEINLSGLDN